MTLPPIRAERDRHQKDINDLIEWAVGLAARTHETNAKANYVDADLDTTAEVRAALNATNAKLNSLIAKLEALTLLANS